ncbi:MAG: helix-turn-helix domain-containing protein [Heliobacteriaceae bacterium]|jgi:DNA-binding XRE family transcriptional regulator|nr:helix-turn-helix domain-containing protein [Heliobacteriaceae bacterium]
MEKEFILGKVAENIRIERLRKRFSQEKLALAAGITQKYLNMIEKSTVNPSIVIVINICAALNIDLNKIWQP